MKLHYCRLLYPSLNAALKINSHFCSFLMYNFLFFSCCSFFFFPSSSKYCQKGHSLEPASLTLLKTGLILPLPDFFHFKKNYWLYLCGIIQLFDTCQQNIILIYIIAQCPDCILLSGAEVFVLKTNFQNYSHSMVGHGWQLAMTIAWLLNRWGTMPGK